MSLTAFYFIGKFFKKLRVILSLCAKLTSVLFGNKFEYAK